MNKNVWLLSACQALLTTGNILLVAVSGLIGQQLAPSPFWITMPVALQFIGLMIATIPASLIMAKLGRKRGFVIGNCIGIFGASVCIFALFEQQFVQFCIGTFLLGIGIGFGTLYRFAAVEISPPNLKARAISTIMAGGVIAAILGPNLAIYSQQWWQGNAFIGAFTGLLALYCIALAILSIIDFTEPVTNEDEDIGQPRDLLDIVRQPIFVVAASSAAISYVVMNLIMTATPLAMHHHGYHFTDSTTVIEWHVLGMFAPAFFTGRLIQRFGLNKIMITGACLMMLCVAINLHGTSFYHFAVALALLGVGWNFMFIGATQLVTSAYAPHEKGKTQASNEFFVFSLVTLSALSAGWLESTLGWQMVNLLTLPFLLVGALILVMFGLHQTKQNMILEK